MHQHDRLDTTAALGEVRRIQRDVHQRTRWQGWIWLLLGAAMPIFLIGTIALEGDWSLGIAISFMAAALLAWFWESRQTVVGRTGARIDRPVTIAFMGAVALVTLLRIFVLPDHLNAAQIIVSFIPSIPCLIGAWLVFRR